MRNYQHDPNRIKCFFVDPTDDYEVEVYRSSKYNSGMVCPQASYKDGGHSAWLSVGVRKIEKPVGGYLSRENAEAQYGLAAFPTKCKCGYEFTDADEYGHRSAQIYQRRDDPIVGYTLQKAPDGAMWYATWYEDHPSMCGEDGHALMVKAPGGRDWHVDGKCSNCTLPQDNVHKCWCRHGDPLTGNVTVDKNGNTCSAGAGSLALPNWHGFLTEGYLHT